jgi:hypothetical protein
MALGEIWIKKQKMQKSSAGENRACGVFAYDFPGAIKSGP